MRLTEEIRTILIYSRDEAMRTGCYSIAPEHLLLGILRHGSNTAVDILRRFEMDPNEVKSILDSRMFHEHAVPFSEQDNLSYSRASLNATSMMLLEAMRRDEDVSAVHLLCALCDNPGEWCGEFLCSHGLSVRLIRTLTQKNSADKKSTLPSSEELNRLMGVFYSEKEIFS